MIDIAQGELQELVGQYTGSIREAKEGVVREDCSEAHSTSVEDCLMTEAAETCVSMDDFNLFTDDDVPEDGKEGEDSWKGRLPVDDEERDMIDFQSVG
jgi:hypothetical protein